MAHTDQLVNYFASTRTKPYGRIGSEVETFFASDSGKAITRDQSQGIMQRLAKSRWEIAAQKGEQITEVRHGTSKVLYELGYPNIELAVCPYEPEQLIMRTRELLDELYRAAEKVGAYPVFAPMFGEEGNYLAMPDDRDTSWLALDGKEALSPLARISAVQFTIDVSPDDAVAKLNRLGARVKAFLERYPQDSVWTEYIRTSLAGYRTDRYGGPLAFQSLEDYCTRLAEHPVVSGETLVPFQEVPLETNESISLFTRSIWWYFRLRRYGPNLCIEVRPLARRRDEMLQKQLDFVLEAVG